MRHVVVKCTLILASTLWTGCKPRAVDASSASSIATDVHSLENYTCPETSPKVAFFDADSTLRVSKISGSVSADGPTDVNILPFVASRLKRVHEDGYLIAIVSNQGGVAAGEVSLGDARAALVFAAHAIEQLGGTVDYIAMAPKYDDERKPKTGMAKRLDALMQERCNVSLDLTHSFMVGDSGYKRGVDGPHPDGRPADDFSNADRLFAKNLLAPDSELTATYFQEPTDFFGWKSYGVYNIETAGQLEDFLITIEARAQVLARAGLGEEASKLHAEVESLRRVNSLTKAWRYVHWNIKELTTAKLVDDKDIQVQTAAKVLYGLAPDLLSINELQYDLADVPTPGLPGKGQNLQRLLGRTNFDNLQSWTAHLEQANTGNQARRKPDGSYATNPNAPDARELADQLNFGVFPGQYSTGFATRFPTKQKFVFTDLAWADWDATFEFAKYKLPDGTTLPPSAVLFDKNFNDVVVDLDGHDVHFVTYHTVPAFGFGAGDDTNIVRNEAQLAFLEWYLLGSCEADAAKSAVRRCEKEMRPLAGKEPFIAVGDLNVDWQSKSPGAAIIKRLLTDARVNNFRAENLDHHFHNDGASDRSYVSFLSGGGGARGDFDLGKLQSELDYFIVSKHLAIEAGRVFAAPSAFTEHSCHDSQSAATNASSTINLDPQQFTVAVSTRYQDDGSRRYCVVSASKDFAEFRKGSDHFPAYITLRWRE